MHNDTIRAANRLGAAALVVGDLMRTGVSAATTMSASAAGALVVLSAQRGLGVTELGRRIGLTQSATSRLVDTLEERALLRRRPTTGGGVALELTAKGRRAVKAVLAGRESGLVDVVGRLAPADQRTLVELLDKVLGAAF